MEVREAMRSTASLRDFTEESVGDDVLTAILGDARFAPSGGNRQPWRVAWSRTRRCAGSWPT